MSPRGVARAVNLGRVGLGIGLVLAPRLAGRGWLGDEAARPATGAVLRAHGSRDAVIGAIALHTLGDDRVGPRWLRTAAICDGVDLWATLAARRALPPSGVAAISAMAAGAVVAQVWAAGRIAGGA